MNLPEYTNFVNSTCNINPYNLQRSIVPKIVLRYPKTKIILDFGSGKTAWHARNLISVGYNITSYEIGKNYNPLYHSKTALQKTYDIVYASNVLNVQPTYTTLEIVLQQIHQCTSKDGIFICNYPYKPRKNILLSTSKMQKTLEKHFNVVSKISSSSPVWICQKS